MIRCYNCDELGSTLKKTTGKDLYCRGNSWDDDKDDCEEYGNYALMALEQGESSASKSEVPILTTIELHDTQYKETVEKMGVEMFNIHKIMMAATEEVSRLSKINEKLEIEKQKLELHLGGLEIVKQENEYLKNKFKCAGEVEVVLRERIEKNDLKLKSFKNASQLVGQYHEKNKPCDNITIGLDYEALNSHKKVEADKGKDTVNNDVPLMLKNVNAPLSKACEVNFDQEELVIKQ
ncbi:hypothetical protein AgCh_012194 [Apium graveolens]